MLGVAGASCADSSPRCKRPLTLDFRHQPTRSELGFAAGAASSSLTCEGVPTTVRLPSGSISLTSSGYAASSLGRSGPADTVYLNSPPLPVAAAARLARQLALPLRLEPVGQIEVWRARMATVAAKDVQDMSSSYLASHDGPVDVSLQLRGSVAASSEATRTAEVQLTFLWRGAPRAATTG